jgi:hypothetical protein
VPGREGRRLVEEEELSEATRLHERLAVPAPELEATRDPALDLVAPTDASVLVVEAATVPVHKATRRIGNQLSQGRNSDSGASPLTQHRRGQHTGIEKALFPGLFP